MKVAFVIFAILGLIVGIFYAIFFAFMGQVMQMATPGDFDRMTGMFSGAMGIFAARAPGPRRGLRAVLAEPGALARLRRRAFALPATGPANRQGRVQHDRGRGRHAAGARGGAGREDSPGRAFRRPARRTEAPHARAPR